jgi:imidazolonepropionase-like amidohydrolase
MTNSRITTWLLAIAAIFIGTVSVRPQAPALAITRVNVVDVVDGRVVPNSTVIIDGGIITGVTSGGAPPAGAHVVDGSERFLIPGLWDMHAHIQGSGEPWLQWYVAIQTATINPARYLGRETTMGTIAPGKAADLVLLDANPLTDIANVRRIRAVVVAGRLLDRQQLDNVLAEVKAAAGQP